ncbi:hypothetical protein Ddye_002554 [Dipteronia dyeriana]|uniref:SHSP domain-containing protein n=1 Tax=Dipteronia dyeriana TaxID=168575 RepID=A0AAD9XRD2_9ROSI|nr:hypothetical protein Ddye_002542 [Dipteronia dyeriana]KAK2663980.1 hypothetical protein Ddye_002554 [Dipteronia dyeriana]
MENVRGTRGFGADRPLSHNPIVRDFVPSSGWTEDSNGHYLLVDLPDFKKEEVKLQVDTSGHVTVNGERLTSDNRYILRFQKTLALPQDSDINRILGKFEGGILYVTVPRLVTVQRQEPEIRKSENENTTNSNNIVEEHKQENPKNDHENNRGDGAVDGSTSHIDEKEKNSHVDDFPEEAIRKWENKEPISHQWVRAMRMLKENKQIVFTALLAFSLGVWVSRKVGPCGHDHIVDGAAI